MSGRFSLYGWGVLLYEGQWYVYPHPDPVYDDEKLWFRTWQDAQEWVDEQNLKNCPF